MKYIKNKIFIASLTLALSIALATAVFYFMGIFNLPVAMTQAALKPFQGLFVSISGALDGYAVYFSNVKELYEENQALKDRVDELEDQLHEAELAAEAAAEAEVVETPEKVEEEAKKPARSKRPNRNTQKKPRTTKKSTKKNEE